MTRPPTPKLLDNFNAPFSQEAEEATIGAVLVNGGLFIQLASFLKHDDFFLLRHNYIWQAFTRIMERNEPIDFVTISEELANTRLLDDIGGYAYLIQLANNTPSSVNAEAYARLVERTSVRRKLMMVADEIKQLALDEASTLDNVISDAEAKLFGVSDTQIKRSFVPMWEALSDYYDRVSQLLMSQGGAVGVPTGFRDLDQLLGGFQKSDLLIFAGRPGMGKCVVGDTLVNTDNGLVTIESLKPNMAVGIPDMEGGTFYPLEIGVQTPTGTQKTSHFFEGGMKPTLTIATRLGYALSGTYTHPVMVLNSLGEKVWKPLGELVVGDYVAVQRHEPRATVSTFSRELNYTRYFRGERKPSYRILEAIAVHAPEVVHLLQPQFYWDEITSISDNGLQAVYDLVVPQGHAFVANGIVSHNTSFLLTLALNAARVGARIAIFTMEMGVEQIVQRIVAMESAINVQNLRLGRLTPQEQARFTEVVGRLSNLGIFIDDTPAMSPLDIRTKSRRLAHEHGLDMIIVDYMQLMNAGKGYENNRVQEISYISRSLKELARELNVPLISAAQLSRAVEQRQDKRPVLSDLRESGCIAGDSLVYLADSGEYVPIQDLAGKAGFGVLSLNMDTYKLERGEVTNAFCTGTKPVFLLKTALGREIRATGNHRFLTIDGWRRLDELAIDDHIALPRTMPALNTQTMPDAELANSDVYWDKIISIQPDGETQVYDLTVTPYSNFVCQSVIIHNSIEQDADIVMFLYRDEIYNEATEYPNQADVIVAKHRNGPTGTVSLYFEKSLTKFMDATTHRVDLSDLQ
jgi:replicative DNA helicase